jgi:osmotically-inducible protein OsmY
MTLKASSLAVVVFAAIVVSAASFARADSAPKATDLTPQFRAAGFAIDRLKAFEIGGIVVIRGRTSDAAVAEQAGRFAQKLGFTRVANLVQVVTPPDDAALAREAERELARQRSLDGCTFHVVSEQGVIKVAGLVRNELQKDMAIQVLRSINGVKDVRTDLQQHQAP